MPEGPAGNSPRPPRRGPFQFGLSTLLFLTIPVALLAGAWAALSRSSPQNAGHRLGLVLVAAAPLALVIVTSLFQTLRRRRP